MRNNYDGIISQTKITAPLLQGILNKTFNDKKRWTGDGVGKRPSRSDDQGLNKGDT